MLNIYGLEAGSTSAITGRKHPAGRSETTKANAIPAHVLRFDSAICRRVSGWCCSSLAWFTSDRPIIPVDNDKPPAPIFHLPSPPIQLPFTYIQPIPTSTAHTTWGSHTFFLTLPKFHDIEVAVLIPTRKRYNLTDDSITSNPHPPPYVQPLLPLRSSEDDTGVT